MEQCKKRILLEWLKEITVFYCFDDGIFEHSLSLLDKFENKTKVLTCQYQLIGCVIYNLSLKYLDDNNEMPVHLWCDLSCNIFEQKDFVEMELYVLKTLDYDIN